MEALQAGADASIPQSTNSTYSSRLCPGRVALPLLESALPGECAWDTRICRRWPALVAPNRSARLAEIVKMSCATLRGRGQQTDDFLRFLRRARDPLQRFAWSRFKNWGLFTISAGRATLCGDLRGRTFYDL